MDRHSLIEELRFAKQDNFVFLPKSSRLNIGKEVRKKGCTKHLTNPCGAKLMRQVSSGKFTHNKIR